MAVPTSYKRRDSLSAGPPYDCSDPAALVCLQLYSGWRMGQLPVGAAKLGAFALQAQLGLTMLLLAALRLVWRIIVPRPINDADPLGWQTRVAYTIHAVFYICFFGLPLSGWAMWSALGNAPLSVADVIIWPDMPFSSLARGSGLAGGLHPHRLQNAQVEAIKTKITMIALTMHPRLIRI